MNLSKQEEILHSANATILAIFEHKDKVPITDGLLMMASYIQFVYPKEVGIDIDYSNCNTDRNIFREIKWDRTKKDKEEGDDIAFYRRIRNSVAHANIDFRHNGKIELFDGPPTKNKALFVENFRVEIDKATFGNEFLKKIMDAWMKSKVKPPVTRKI